ncbi:MAG: elongation factor P-like protein YeiP [Gammaproteobacteria bacterium]|nr:elongation factor P-like protein YeiP [Gammaproteobacteria bacterium]
MPKASELKRGQVIDINNTPHAVKTIDCKSPSSRGASTIYKIRYNNLVTGQKLDESYKADDVLKEADCQRTRVQYSYLDGDNVVFMDTEDYSQYSLSRDELGEDFLYITEGLEGITALLSDDRVLGIELPQVVEMEIVETDPSIKGASATGRTKPARFATGLEIQVPEYLSAGGIVKINTTTGKFMSRA